MKKILILILIFASYNTNAIELVCNGGQPNGQNQRVIKVDCNNRRIVVESLKDAWRALRKEGIGGHMEDLCWEAFNDVKNLHPVQPIEIMAPIYFAKCNIALQYLK